MMVPDPIPTPNGSVIIRPAVAQDADRLLSLRLEGLSLHPEAFAADAEMTQQAGAGAWAERVSQYAQDNSGVIVVAEAGDELVGLTGLGRGHWPKTRHSAMLWGVYVRPAWRGSGIGEALVTACVAWGRHNQLSVLTLGVVTSNQAAIRCYARCGFTVYGTQPRVLYYRSAYYDELLMARLL